MPANFFTEEIEIKDGVAIMLFKLKSVFVSTGRNSDKPERINIYPIHTEIFAPKINEINFIPGRTVFVTSEKYRPTNHRPRTALCH